LRDTLGSIFGIYALMRYVSVIVARLRGQPPPNEETEITHDSLPVTDPNAPPTPRASKKPLVIFLLAVFGLPYLIGKLIRAMAHYQSHTLPSRNFDPSSVQLYRVKFDFIPQNLGSEVPLRKGEIIAIVTRTHGGWWRARLRDGREGYVPATYLESIVNLPHTRHTEGPSRQGAGHAFVDEFKGE
jgi:peroxin-13